MVSKLTMQEPPSIHLLPFLSKVNSGTDFICLHSLRSTTQILPNRHCQHTLKIVCDHSSGTYSYYILYLSMKESSNFMPYTKGFQLEYSPRYQLLTKDADIDQASGKIILCPLKEMKRPMLEITLSYKKKCKWITNILRQMT